MAELTPMMRQYRRIKADIPEDAILMFRLGDFYEMFFEDAVTAAPILGVALTRRAGAPMCGVPYHAVDAYLAKLIRAGKRAALCDQMEEAPSRGKSIVRREVTRVVTPGTVTEDGILDESRNNYIAAVCADGQGFGLALLDLSTGAFTVERAPSAAALADQLRRCGPSECIVPAGQRNTPEMRAACTPENAGAVTEVDDWTMEYDCAYDCLLRHFNVHSLDGFGCEGDAALVRPAGGLLHYVHDVLRHGVDHIRALRRRSADDFLALDESTCLNLDLVPRRGAPAETALLGVLNRARTPMGARLMRAWITRPLRKLNEINARHDSVEFFCSHRPALNALREKLGEIRDIERLVTRIDSSRGNAREVRALALSLLPVPGIRALFYNTNDTDTAATAGTAAGTADTASTAGTAGTADTMTAGTDGAAEATGTDGTPGPDSAAEAAAESPAPPAPAPFPALPPPAAGAPALLREAAAALDGLPELAALICRAIVDAPPASLTEGGIIRPGFRTDLDELRTLAGEGHAWLANYQAQEQKRTGIKTLKVRHNKVFGFYIEISKAQAASAPPEYERRQTLVNAERFVTPELREYEQKIFGVRDRAAELEAEIFAGIRERVAAQTAAIQKTAAAIARLDALASLADRALALGYVRPLMTEDGRLEIRDGRHPVIEQLPGAEPFVPNDTLLDCSANQICLITGPNMAGKSTYIRQVAVIAIMAHIGSFVPARSARISLLDRVFTRVGAGDDLARGRSTFMVEMQETANILNNATPNSLIVLDEIGRGTSTFDGISIAWAVAEFLHNTPRVKAKTLFATHYHELTDLALTLPGVKNYTVQVRECGSSIVFLRRIALGTADKSYGIHVACLAGLPAEVIERSREILSNLEEGEAESGVPKIAKRRDGKKRNTDLPGQMTFF